MNYQYSIADPIAATPFQRDQTLLVQLTLRTLGEVKASTDGSGLLGTAP